MISITYILITQKLMDRVLIQIGYIRLTFSKYVSMLLNNLHYLQ